jgi:hypothetical protein
VWLPHPALDPFRRRAVEREKLHREVDEMAEMVPENVVGPGAPVTRGPHVFEPRDEELTGQVAQMLVAPGDLLEQRLAFAPEAHRMAEGEHRAGLPSARRASAWGTCSSEGLATITASIAGSASSSSSSVVHRRSPKRAANSAAASALRPHGVASSTPGIFCSARECQDPIVP